MESVETTLFFGTDLGHIIIAPFANSTLCEGGKRVQDIDTAARRGQVYKKKAHGDWVGKIRYYHELHSVVSCSRDPKKSLVIGTLDAGQNRWRFTSVQVDKGVNTFALCMFPVVLATGGTDRRIRLWNPRKLTHPMASLKGHNSPITDIVINQAAAQLISLSVDRVIKVWDLRKQHCVQTLFDPISREPENIISAIYFNTLMNNKLLVASNVITVYNVKVDLSLTAGAKSHENNVRCALFNPIFREVVTACDNGVIKVWVSVAIVL
jgi:WD40 repeat protein